MKGCASDTRIPLRDVEPVADSGVGGQFEVDPPWNSVASNLDSPSRRQFSARQGPGRWNGIGMIRKLVLKNSGHVSLDDSSGVRDG